MTLGLSYLLIELVYKTPYKSFFFISVRARKNPSSETQGQSVSFQAQAEEPLGTDSHRTISKRSSECWLLIGHKKCFVLLCPIGEQHLLSSFREFVHDATAIDSITACLAYAPNKCTQSGKFQFDINTLFQNTGWLSLHQAVK